MFLLTDPDAAKLRQRELLDEAFRAQLAERVAPRGPSLMSRLLRSVTQRFESVDDDRAWPAAYGRRRYAIPQGETYR